jgi:hypothetical protein
MAKQEIGMGSGPLAGDGESLHTAFTKVNENFTELYGLVGTGGNLNLGAFEFNGSTLTTTDSSAIIIDQATTVTSDLTVGGDILPNVANGGNLGSPAKPFRSLFVSNNTIFFGGVPLSLEPGTNELRVNNVPISQTINYADIANVPTAFSGSYADLSNKPTIPVDIEDLTDTGNALASELVSPTVPTIGGTASAGEAGITYLSGELSKWAIFTVGAFTIGEWTDVQPGWTVTDNNGFTDTIAGRGSFGAASFQTTVNNWPSPASGKTYVFTSPDYQLGYTNPVEITVGDNDWTFDLNGVLTLPIGATNNGRISNINGISLAVGTNFWTVDGDGGLTFPDTTVQTTAYTGPQTTLDGDVTGSVFADNSTLLVDGVSGKIVGEVDTLIGSIVNLESANFGVETIYARNQFGVNIGAGGFNNLIVLENEVRIQNVPFNVGSNDIILTSNNNEAGRITTSNSSIQIQAEVDFEIRVNQTFDRGTPEEETETALWSFESNGELYFPDGTIQTTAYTGGIDSDPTQLLFEAGADEELISHSAGFVEGDPVFQIRLNTHLDGEAQTIWGFGTDGVLTLPAGGDIKDSEGNSVLGQDNDSTADLGNFVFTDSDMSVAVEELFSQSGELSARPQGGNAWDFFILYDPESPIETALGDYGRYSDDGYWQITVNDIEYKNGVEVYVETFDEVEYFVVYIGEETEVNYTAGDSFVLSRFAVSNLRIKAPEDLYLDALGDDVIVRASDDIRLRAGYDFETNDYDWQFRFTDGGEQIFFNGNEEENYGRITPNLFDEGVRGLTLEGEDQIRLRVDNSGNELILNSEGELIFSDNTIQSTAYTGLLSTAAVTGSEELNLLTPALNLTKSIQKLSNGYYSLPNGVEGQIMYFVPVSGVTQGSSVGIAMSNVRQFGGENGTAAVQNNVWFPFFQNAVIDDGTAVAFNASTIAYAIFTDGAWNVFGGGMD